MTTTKLKDVQDAIKKKGARWVAGETSVSGLDPSKIPGLLGLREDPKELAASYEAAMRMKAVVAVAPPAKADWSPYATSVKNQSGCGACVSFAVIATLEAQLKIHFYRDRTHEVDLSEGHLFFCSGGSCSYGMMVLDACNYLIVNGVPPEECYPYEQAMKMKSCAGTCPDWKDKVGDTKVISSERPGSERDVKAYIAANGPMIATMWVYADFLNYREGIYEHVSGTFLGGHAVAVFGYDDIEGYWLGKNSWGDNWGENSTGGRTRSRGWFRIAYGQCYLGAPMMALNVKEAPPTPVAEIDPALLLII